jgi:hypothetical protein
LEEALLSGGRFFGGSHYHDGYNGWYAMTDDLDISADSVEIKKEWQARSDLKRRGSLFQVRLDDEMTLEMEHFMLKNGFNRSQALKHILQEFFRNH